jgi:hypothetical protein
MPTNQPPQTWLPFESSVNVGHGSGIVQILATAPYRNSQDPFEQNLLLTITGPVVRNPTPTPSLNQSPKANPTPPSTRSSNQSSTQKSNSTPG